MKNKKVRWRYHVRMWKKIHRPYTGNIIENPNKLVRKIAALALDGVKSPKISAACGTIGLIVMKRSSEIWIGNRISACPWNPFLLHIYILALFPPPHKLHSLTDSRNYKKTSLFYHVFDDVAKLTVSVTEFVIPGGLSGYVAVIV